jgi:hypothetical protein
VSGAAGDWPGRQGGIQVAVPDGWHAGVELAGVAEELVRPLVVACSMRGAWIRRYPHSGFSVARRTTRRAIAGIAGGRPGLRRLLVSYFFAASLRCQASSVAGVTGKTSAQRLRGMSRASAANHTRSAGSYRTWPAFRRSTAFSCRSTSSSASFASPYRTPRRPGRVAGEPAGRRS